MDKDKIKTFTVTDEQGRIDKFLASVSSKLPEAILKSTLTRNWFLSITKLSNQAMPLNRVM
jgi:hypothetical protein